MSCRELVYGLACIVSAFAVANGSGTVALGQQPKESAEDQSSFSFKGKIVVLEVTGGSGLNSQPDSVVMANARIMKVGNRDFIVGDAFPLQDEDDEWHKDITVGVPCDNIVQFRTMTPERFKS